MKNFGVFLYFVFGIFFSIHGHVHFSEIEKNIYHGDLTKARLLIDISLKSKTLSKKELVRIYTFKGDIAKIEGDIEAAMEYWNKASQVNELVYTSKKDYHHAWKYAHLSYYHYQKINKTVAKTYADSCQLLVQNLTIQQQKEIEIFKIWNILAQVTKMQHSDVNDVKFSETYQKTKLLYEKSLEFQFKHQINKHNLAKTYHLLGNMYVDLSFLYHTKKEFEFLQKCERKAVENYDKAIGLWNELYGNHHYELGKTYFLKGLYFFYQIEIDSMHYMKKANEQFEKSFDAFSLNVRKDKVNSALNPNKADLLMFLKHYTANLISMSAIDKKCLKKAEEINDVAIRIWQQIHKTYSAKNVNQNLAIYELIPQAERIAILKKKLGVHSEEFSHAFFKLNQKLKYYDLLNESGSFKELEIKEFQKKLKPKQLFLDFHICNLNQEVYVAYITNSNVEIKVLPLAQENRVKLLKKSILEFEFEKYADHAHILFQEIFPKGLKQFKELIICPDGFYNELPFEALLCTKSKSKQNDYRELDYLIKHISVNYAFTTHDVTNILFRTNWDLSVFTPNFHSQKISKLPFSTQLGERLESDFSARLFSKQNATTESFLSAQSQIVHVSTHSSIGNEVTSNHISFSDRKLFQHELVNLKSKAKFWVINSCNSSQGKFLSGDGIQGVTKELHKKGISASITNRWEVDDKSSNELFYIFYKKLHSGFSAHKSLQQAQIEQLKNAPSSELGAPYYWAGHRLVGGEVCFEQEGEKVYWLLFIGFCLTGMFILKKIRLKNLGLKK